MSLRVCLLICVGEPLLCAIHATQEILRESVCRESFGDIAISPRHVAGSVTISVLPPLEFLAEEVCGRLAVALGREVCAYLHVGPSTLYVLRIREILDANRVVDRRPIVKPKFIDVRLAL